MLLCMSRSGPLPSPVRSAARAQLGLPHLASALLALAASACGGATGEPAQTALSEPARAEERAAAEPGLDATSRAALSGLDAASRDALARASFPVLLFPARWTSQVMSVEGQPWVAVATHDDGLHVSLHGSSLAHPDLRDEEVANLPTPTTLVRGTPAWITLNEQIRSAAWHEGAVAWSLEVECDRPFDDPRCTEERFVRELAETLVVIDPQSAGGAR